MRMIELGPEQGEECVAAVKTGGPGGGEITEQGEELGPPQNRTELLSVGVPEIHSPQHPEPDHSSDLVGWAPLAAV